MNPYEIVNHLIKPLPTRVKEILRRRFGLNRKKPQTLQEIGTSYDLSRERIRQIQDRALASVKNCDIYKPILLDLEKIFVRHKKLASAEKLSQEFAGFQAPYFFILHVDDGFTKFCDNRDFKYHWASDKNIADQTQKGILDLTKYLANNKEPISKQEVLDYVDLDYLEISKLIGKSVFEQFGLIDWPEITPAGVKDKAYLILKKVQKPLHFKEITDLINQTNFSDGRRAYSPTVHNELIRDPRFVRQGLGIYGLSNNLGNN